MTITHQNIWDAIDEIARRHNASLAHLARISGLDITSLTESKRFTQGGRPRWPSMATLIKILDATGTSLTEFAEIVTDISRRTP